MSILETAHTFSAINRVKKDITKLLSIISLISFIIFTCYYSYLIISNYNNLLYLVIYIVLFITVIVTFLTELILKNKKDYNRKEKRINYERKQVIKIIAKLLKYIAKAITIFIAIVSIINQQFLTITSLFTISSAFLLIIQILLEFIIYYVCRYIDYFKLALELDKDNGVITKFFFRKGIKAAKLEKKALDLEGISYYTKQEEKMIETLVNDAKKYKEEKEIELRERIKLSKSKIKELTKKELTEKQKQKIEEKYEIILAKSNDILSNQNDLDKLLIKIENMIGKLPKEVEALKYIPRFVSLINNYVAKKYTNVSIEFVLAVIAIIVYIVSPVDVIPDFIPGVGYLDESYLICKCIDEFEEELTKFIIWRDNQNQ